MIRNLFITKEYNPRGKYKIRIFDPVHRKWEIVTIDDKIPCYKGTKKPRFMSPNGNELWAVLLEKAYAKYCGSYANLAGGFVLWGWLSMTGDNVFQLSLEDGNNKKNKKKTATAGSWYREDMKAIDKRNDRRACGFVRTKETYTQDNIWTLLKKYDQQKVCLRHSRLKQ